MRCAGKANFALSSKAIKWATQAALKERIISVWCETWRREKARIRTLSLFFFTSFPCSFSHRHSRSEVKYSSSSSQSCRKWEENEEHFNFHLFVCTIMFPIARSSREEKKKDDGHWDYCVRWQQRWHRQQRLRPTRRSTWAFLWIECFPLSMNGVFARLMVGIGSFSFLFLFHFYYTASPLCFFSLSLLLVRYFVLLT